MTADVHLLADETKTSVAAVCRAFELPRSTVYARRKRPMSKRERANVCLDVDVAAIHVESEKRYGSPRIYRALKRQGRKISRKRVAQRMRILGLHARRPKRFRRTTEADPSKVPAPNLLDRDFDGWLPDQAWVADITYIWTLLGWVYLAIVVDLGTRAIVGWAVSKHCDTKLALGALNAAVARRRPPPGTLHHTDRGATYTADDYQARLRSLGMLVSMSRKGDCWDNAVAESTIGTIKSELLGELVPDDIYHVQHMLFPYIESFYNRKRLHSSLGYRTPHEAELLARDSKIVA